MAKLKFTLAYDGRPWKGWQSQRGGCTIQDKLEEALLRICGERVVVHGSGRTDAGVHARAQTMHIRPPESSALTEEIWIKALNANLPPSIRVMTCERVADDFHARFQTTGKVYEYRIWRPLTMNPFEDGLAWHLHGPLDMELLREGAHALCGRHNFSRLSANRGEVSEEERREDAGAVTRTVRRVDVLEEGDMLRLEFVGDGFLYKMVRLMTGSLIHAARGRAPLEWVRSLVQEPHGPKSNHCAPADGLFLVRVMY